MIEAFFIVFILQFSNYMPVLLGDKPSPGKLNKYLTDNIYTLNILLLFIIYFSVKGIDDPEKNLYIKIRETIILWMIYQIYIKLEIKYCIIVFILFLILYSLREYKEHNTHITDIKYIDDNIDKVILANKIIIGIVMLVGLILHPPKIKKFEDFLKPIK